MSLLGAVILGCVGICFALACLNHMLPPADPREPYDWWDEGA